MSDEIKKNYTLKFIHSDDSDNDDAIKVQLIVVTNDEIKKEKAGETKPTDDAASNDLKESYLGDNGKEITSAVHSDDSVFGIADEESANKKVKIDDDEPISSSAVGKEGNAYVELYDSNKQLFNVATTREYDTEGEMECSAFNFKDMKSNKVHFKLGLEKVSFDDDNDDDPDSNAILVKNYYFDPNDDELMDELLDNASNSIFEDDSELKYAIKIDLKKLYEGKDNVKESAEKMDTREDDELSIEGDDMEEDVIDHNDLDYFDIISEEDEEIYLSDEFPANVDEETHHNLS